uniref:Uncharacterized protein n=1 Tax=Arundo donax TaxID=35708 RepID=A0A0A9A9Y0_ARUDO
MQSNKKSSTQFNVQLFSMFTESRIKYFSARRKPTYSRLTLEKTKPCSRQGR